MLSEGDETLTVTLTHAIYDSGSGTAPTPNEATTTIVDRWRHGAGDYGRWDSTQLILTSASVNDAQTFTVTLSGAVSTDVTLGYDTADGTATAGTDSERTASHSACRSSMSPRNNVPHSRWN